MAGIPLKTKLIVSQNLCSGSCPACVSASSCFEGFAVFFKANKADAASLDAGDVYSAVKLYGLTVVAKEIYDQGRFTKQRMSHASALSDEALCSERQSSGTPEEESVSSCCLGRCME